MPAAAPARRPALWRKAARHPMVLLGASILLVLVALALLARETRAEADKLLLFGAHMPFPALGRVRKAGNAYDYRIEPFVLG